MILHHALRRVVDTPHVPHDVFAPADDYRHQPDQETAKGRTRQASACAPEACVGGDSVCPNSLIMGNYCARGGFEPIAHRRASRRVPAWVQTRFRCACSRHPGMRPKSGAYRRVLKRNYTPTPLTYRYEIRIPDGCHRAFGLTAK